MKTLDFLCPGDWQDSYESRIVNPNSYTNKGGYAVNGIQDVMNCCKVFLAQCSNYFDLFNLVELYIDDRCFGYLYRNGRLEVFPPSHIDVTAERFTSYYQFGDKNLLFNVNSYKYLGRH